MTTVVVVAVREDSADFHGVLAHVAMAGDGSPAHFQAAARAAMRQAGRTLPQAYQPIHYLDWEACDRPAADTIAPGAALAA